MGGSSSSRWRGHTPKRLVEETPAIDLLHPVLKTALAAPAATGSLTWRTETGARVD